MSKKEIKQIKKYLKYQIDHFENVEKLPFLVDFIYKLDSKLTEKRELEK